MTCSHQPGSGVSLSFTLLLVTSIGALGFLVGARQSAQPEWDCYRSIWSNDEQMALHGLIGASAVEVHQYCIESMQVSPCECDNAQGDYFECPEYENPSHLFDPDDLSDTVLQGGIDSHIAGSDC